MPDAKHILNDELPVTQEGTLDITPEAILQTRVHTLQNCTINKYLIKWTSYPDEDATWEREDLLQKEYPEFLSR